MKKIKETFIRKLPLLVAITLLSATFYVGLQQTIRLLANEPQIQIVKDVANVLVNGVDPVSILGDSKTEISITPDPYIIIYDLNGKLIASSATLNGEDPKIPTDVLNYVKIHGEERLTWQPELGLRQAIVAAKYNGSNSGIIVVGRSLEETEKLINTVGFEMLIGWLLTIILSFFAALLPVFIFKKKKE